LIRHSGDARPLLTELPKSAREIDSRFFASGVAYGDMINAAARGAGVAAGIASVLGALCLTLACVGIYGVAAYNVSQRKREVGVRMALGARPRTILAMMFKQNLRTVVIGAVVGVMGAIAFGLLLTSLLYGVSPTDPVALTATAAILFGTSSIAAWGPAHRAASVDPAITLRHE
jgi:putative ABC transport system permease protein